MQASRQNTRQLQAGESEVMEWRTYGYEWSILNYGPGDLWFSYTPGVDAVPGEVQSTKLESGYSYTDSTAHAGYIRVSLHAEGALTYCLNTNQLTRSGGGGPPPGGGGIDDAPLDGVLYGRKNAGWIRAIEQTGDTIDGIVNIHDPGSMDNELRLRCQSDHARILFRKNDIGQFSIDGNDEHLVVNRYAPDGTFKDVPISVEGTDGRVVLRLPTTITGNPVADNDLVRKAYADQKVDKAGDTMIGSLEIRNGGLIINVPIDIGDAMCRLQGDEASLIAFRPSSGPRWFFGSDWRAGPHQDNLRAIRINSDLTSDTVFEIRRSDGHVVGGRFETTAGDPVAADDLVRRAFVMPRSRLAAPIVGSNFSGELWQQSLLGGTLVSLAGTLISSIPIVPDTVLQNVAVLAAENRPASTQFLPILFSTVGGRVVHGAAQIVIQGAQAVLNLISGRLVGDPPEDIRNVLINVIYSTTI